MGNTLVLIVIVINSLVWLTTCEPIRSDIRLVSLGVETVDGVRQPVPEKEPEPVLNSTITEEEFFKNGRNFVGTLTGSDYNNTSYNYEVSIILQEGNPAKFLMLVLDKSNPFLFSVFQGSTFLNNGVLTITPKPLDKRRHFKLDRMGGNDVAQSISEIIISYDQDLNIMTSAKGEYGESWASELKPFKDAKMKSFRGKWKGAFPTDDFMASLELKDSRGNTYTKMFYQEAMGSCSSDGIVFPLGDDRVYIWGEGFKHTSTCAHGYILMLSKTDEGISGIYFEDEYRPGYTSDVSFFK